MKDLLIVLALMLSSTVALAEVKVKLDGQVYGGVERIDYRLADNVVEIETGGLLLCSIQGGTPPGISSVVSLRLDGQLYLLGGDLELDFTTQPPQLKMVSLSGGLVCNPERIFRDRFAPAFISG